MNIIASFLLFAIYHSQWQFVHQIIYYLYAGQAHEWTNMTLLFVPRQDNYTESSQREWKKKIQTQTIKLYRILIYFMHS